jgi:hypothetical protein
LASRSRNRVDRPPADSRADRSISGRAAAIIAQASPLEPPAAILEQLTPRSARSSLWSSGTFEQRDRQATRRDRSDVKSHVGSILMKLNLRDRVQAVVFAYEHGIITAGANPTSRDPPPMTPGGRRVANRMTRASAGPRLDQGSSGARRLSTSAAPTVTTPAAIDAHAHPDAGAPT